MTKYFQFDDAGGIKSLCSRLQGSSSNLEKLQIHDL